MVFTPIQIGMLGGMTSLLGGRNFIYKPTQIDIRKNDFCTFLSPKKINFIFFDYYEYFVSWNTVPCPPCYKYWNLTWHRVQFIKETSDYKPNIGKVVNPKIF